MCFALDIAGTDIVKGNTTAIQRWEGIYPQGVVLAALDILSNQPEKAKRVTHAARHGDDELYKWVIRVSSFFYLNDLITTFDGINFALVRLFGGHIRPFMCSIYLATATHPRVTHDSIKERELSKAMLHFESAYSDYPPVYFPKWDFDVPIPDLLDAPNVIRFKEPE